MLLAVLSVAVAGEVLIPKAAPISSSDYAASYAFYEMVLAAARDQGLDYDDADEIRAMVTEDERRRRLLDNPIVDDAAIRVVADTAADTCYVANDCPASLWPRTDARLAMVLGVGNVGGKTLVEVRYHGADDAVPIKVMSRTVTADGQRALATELVATAAELLTLLPPRPPREVRPAPVTPVTPPPVATTPVATTHPPTTPTPTTSPKPDGPRVAADLEERLPKGAVERWKSSGLDIESWALQERVRVGHVTLEFGGGYAVGDVDRGYSVIANIDSTPSGIVDNGRSSWEGPAKGAAPVGTVSVAYAPAWFLDTGLTVGIIGGTKFFQSGYECESGCGDTEQVLVDAVDKPGIQAVIQPRARLVAVPTGVVKPYALGAVSLRVHDGFDITTSVVELPDTPSGAILGATVGAGSYIDIVPLVSLFVEVPCTFWFSDETRERLDGDVKTPLQRFESSGRELKVAAGISVSL